MSSYAEPVRSIAIAVVGGSILMLCAYTLASPRGGDPALSELGLALGLTCAAVVLVIRAIRAVRHTNSKRS